MPSFKHSTDKIPSNDANIVNLIWEIIGTAEEFGGLVAVFGCIFVLVIY